ncbi:MAG: hypothetical protein IPK12_13795 [Gemmatimonadetes bacterium]|nr:hypothetical protein [Gemmatimonadota bacterium]
MLPFGFVTTTMLAGALRAVAPPVPHGWVPEPRLARAAQVLALSETGRAALAQYDAAGYEVRFAGPAERAANRGSRLTQAAGRAPDFLTDHTFGRVLILGDSLPPAALAVGLVHELIHIRGGAQPGSWGIGQEEVQAWETALDYYASLPAPLRLEAAPKYQPYADWRARDRTGFRTTFRCVFPGTPGCPIVTSPR